MYNNLLCQCDYCMVNHAFIMHGGPVIMGVLGCCGGDLWEMIGCFMALIEEMISQGNEGTGMSHGVFIQRHCIHALC